jgi:hypothetical protein
MAFPQSARVIRASFVLFVQRNKLNLKEALMHTNHPTNHTISFYH